jgi:rod shape-determining protein MreD
MKSLNTILILLVAFVAVFLQAAVGTRGWIGAQIDLLPALIVYVSLTSGVATVALLAVCGGLWFDSLSANPLGISMLPLFVVGWVIHQNRELILRKQIYAQFIIGLTASASAPLLTLLLLFSTGRSPLVGWGTLWQWFVMSVGGGLLTPVCFRFFRFINHEFFYQPVKQPSFRTDREIRRGRF